MSDVFQKDVLVVEDNVIIAMDVEELVLSVGASKAHVAASVEQALKVLDAVAVEAAILDFNLVDETSEPVAQALKAKGVPFVFATGYSGMEELPVGFKDVNLLEKPFTAEDIRAAFASLALSAA